MHPAASPASAPAALPAPAKPTGAYRAVHTADWHLGKMLGSLDRLEEQRRFLLWLEEFLLSSRADALLVAGDLFDSATPPQAAVRLYYDFLASLHRRSENRCAVIVTAGNHDSPAQLAAPGDLLRLVNTRVVASLPRGDSDSGGADCIDRAALLIPLPPAEGAKFTETPRLIVAAVPFLRERDLRTGEPGQSAEAIQAALQQGIARRYREAAEAAEVHYPGVPCIAMGHLTALGSRTSSSEREIHVGGLGAVGADAFPAAFSYVALGHLHRPQPVGGREHLRYSGSPIALSFSEADDTKELRLLDFTSGGLAAQHAIPIPQPRRLLRLRIPLADLARALRHDFFPAAEPNEPNELPAWIELTVTGASRSEDLYTLVQETIGNQEGFEVVRILAETDAAPLQLESTPDGDATDLLSDPRAVFAKRLALEALDEPAETAVNTAFDELYSRLLESEEQPQGVL